MSIDWLHEMEIVVNLWIQNLGGWLLVPSQIFSFLGTENFYMFIMPALYWCFNASLGLRIGMIYLLSSGLHSTLKLAFHTPRPYWVDARVQAYAAEAGFGLPSGHATSAASVWGLVAASLRKPIARGLFIVLFLLIGLSRLYLGVHYLSDVLLGWALGGTLLWLVLYLEKQLAGWIKSCQMNTLLALIAASSIVLVLLVLGVQASLAGWQLPPAWNQMALTKTGEPIDPLNLDGAFTLGGTWLGLVGGAAWLFRARGGLVTSGTLVQRVLRYMLGLVGIVIFWFGLGQVFPRNPDMVSYLLRFLRYTLIGVWISAAAPLLFVRLGLSKPAQSHTRQAE